MQWPWVARSEYEAVRDLHSDYVANLRQDLADLRILLRDKDAEIQRLTDRQYEMQREGYTPPSPPFEMPEPERLPEAVEKAISVRGKTADRRRYLEGFAWAELNAGADPAAVAEAVLNGEG